MNDNVIFLRGQPSKVGHFLRVGSNGYRQLETLIAAGRMPLSRFVIDAGSVGKQKELISSLKEEGCELVLDTNVAELSCVGKFDGNAKGAPWADPEGALTAEHFKRGHNHDLIGKIARYAVETNFNAVQTPSHLLQDSASPWLSIDRESCVALRRSLDAEGGSNISVDYPLMITFATLRDPVQRRALVSALRDLPFDNLWLRISGFGSDATAMGLRRYIAAATDLLGIGRPIVADSLGGLPGLAAIAFGAAGGIAHGVAEKERFDARGWEKPRAPGGGGNGLRVLVPGLDRFLSLSQMEQLMAAPGGRRICSCSDRKCCPHGWDDTKKDPKAHYLYQRSKQFENLSRIPDARRAEHFLNKDLADADREARKAARIRTSDDSLRETLLRSSERLEKMSAVLEELQNHIGDSPRSPVPVKRQAKHTDSAAKQR